MKWNALALTCSVICVLATDVSVDQARVINGKPVPIEKVPYAADYSGCGATVIGRTWLLSAAHCFDPTLRRALRVGSARVRRGTRLQVIRGVPHPQFKPRGYWGRYDFLLLELGVPLVFNSTVQPAQLYHDGESVAVNATGLVAAFGRTAFNGSRSRTLLLGEVAVLSPQECVRGVRHLDPEVMLCARGAPHGSNVCKGDSGGALTIDGRIAGVVSWGDDGCPVEAPAVFAKVAAVRHWIRNVTSI